MLLGEVSPAGSSVYLGNGSSMRHLQRPERRLITGFTAVDGLVMGTRTGNSTRAYCST